MLLIQMIQVFGYDFFLKKHSDYYIPSRDFPRLADSTYCGMNKIQNNDFLLALLRTRPDPFNTYHFSLSSEGWFQRSKEKKNRPSEETGTSSSSSAHSGNTVHLVWLFAFSFLSHTAHKNALDTSAARKKRGFCRSLRIRI